MSTRTDTLFPSTPLFRSRLTRLVGERRIEGRILEKAEAERAYRAAADNGQRASLVSGERPNVFVTAVANIGPGEDITVEIGFQDAVRYENGVFALRFPMVVAPRYTPAPVADIAEAPAPRPGADRSEEHTSELQSLMRISYAVFSLTTQISSTHED